MDRNQVFFRGQWHTLHVTNSVRVGMLSKNYKRGGLEKSGN